MRPEKIFAKRRTLFSAVRLFFMPHVILFRERFGASQGQKVIALADSAA